MSLIGDTNKGRLVYSGEFGYDSVMNTVMCNFEYNQQTSTNHLLYSCIESARKVRTLEEGWMKDNVREKVGGCRISETLFFIVQYILLSRHPDRRLLDNFKYAWKMTDKK